MSHVDFKILGALEVAVDGAVVPAGRRRERCLLGLLLLEPYQAISVDRLISLLWDDARLPNQPQRALQSNVARLRAVLGGLPVADPPRLVSVGSGYALHVPPASVDAHRFREMVARSAGLGPPERRAALLGRALELWRGPVLDGTFPPTLRERLCGDLEELRLTAGEDWFECELLLGRHRDRVGELAGLVAEHPDRERLLGLYMTALDRCGRTSAALRAYEERRLWLAENEGLDPGSELRTLHAAILRGENTMPPGPVMVAPAAATVQEVAGSPATGPSQLLAAPAMFVGRQAQMQALDMHAADPARMAAPIVITGMGGVGKTALAMRWAHRAAAEFPDGQLYYDLRGFDDAKPVPALQVLSAFLRALGAEPHQIPHDLDEATALYRTMTDGRRMLVVLDNVGQVDTAQALLPHNSSVLVLITSRDQMLGLVARVAARLVPIDVLPAEDSVRLVGAIVGDDRVQREPVAAAALAAACGHLPLALRIAAANLAGRPAGALSEMLTELRGGSIDRLAVEGDARTSVRALLNHSYLRLDPAAARLFRLMGVVPAVTFDPVTAAAVCGLATETVSALLEQLTAAHLVVALADSRYTFHDLVRQYAGDLMLTRSPQEPAEAVQRLRTYLLDRIRAAVVRMEPHAVRLPAPDTPNGGQAYSFQDTAAARRWLDAEFTNIAAVAAHAAGQTHPAAWLIADNLRRYLYLRGNAVDALALAEAALQSARADGDPWALAAALLSGAFAQNQAGQFEHASQCALEASQAAARAPWPRGQAAALQQLGDVEIERGDFKAAAAALEQARLLAQQCGDMYLEADAVNGLGGVELQQGRLQTAEVHYRAAHTLYWQLESHSGTAAAMTNLAEIRMDLGHPAEAVQLQTAALEIYRQLEHQDGTAFLLARLAVAKVELGLLDEALLLATEGLEVADRAHLPYRRVPVLNALGLVSRLRGDLPSALRYHEEALGSARSLQLNYLVPECLQGIAEAHLQARHLSPALATATELVQQAAAEGYPLQEIIGQILLSEIAQAQDDRQTAVRWARRALEPARAGGFRLAEARALAALARVSEPATARGLLARASDLVEHTGGGIAARVADHLAGLH